MDSPKYKVVLSKEVVEFLRGLNPKAIRKIASIIDYVAAGDINTDFFKKTRKYGDLGISGSIHGYRISLAGLLGYERKCSDYHDTWFYKENSKNSTKRNRESSEKAEGIFQYKIVSYGK